jgi:hypothetical protein
MYASSNPRGSDNPVFVNGASYDYSPSVMLDGVYRMWWCCGSTSGGVAGDHICYAEASSLDGPWHAHGNGTANTHDEVFHGTGNLGDFDGTHTCDPSVIRVEDGTYYMYYGGLAENAPSSWTRIGVASSPDGFNWTRLNGGKAIIDAARDPNANNLPNKYGAGQPSVTEVDGLFYLIHTDTTGLGGNQGNGAGQYVLRSADPTFQNSVEELTSTGFVAKGSVPTTKYSLLEAFATDWQYSGRGGDGHPFLRSPIQAPTDRREIAGPLDGRACDRLATRQALRSLGRRVRDAFGGHHALGRWLDARVLGPRS